MKKTREKMILGKRGVSRHQVRNRTGGGDRQPRAIANKRKYREEGKRPTVCTKVTQDTNMVSILEGGGQTKGGKGGSTKA